jgi:hypothetical protein
MKRQYARDFPHHVCLTNAGDWRTSHISHALRGLSHETHRWWTEGELQIWGFRSIGDAVDFELWATSSGIDWTVAPPEQIERPPAPPEGPLHYGPSWREDGGRVCG